MRVECWAHACNSTAQIPWARLSKLSHNLPLRIGRVSALECLEGQNHLPSSKTYCMTRADKIEINL